MEAIQLTGTIRDFQDSHPDFEYRIGSDPGIVQTLLGSDKKPIYAGQTGNPTTNGQISFDQWYRDVSEVNLSKQYSITLEDPDKDGIFTYTNNSFFPIDGELFGNQRYSHNYHFTYELHSQFTYRGGEIFKFFGDDDLFVFIDNKLVLDLGGVHEPASGLVNLDELELTVGETYDFDFFFAERHTYGSAFKIETSIALEPTLPETLKVRGTDAIFLAGRTDITVPPLGDTSSKFPLARHGFVRSDFLQETFPQSISVQSGETFTFEAKGTIDFFNGTSRPFTPDGNDPNGSSLFSLGEISGYQGPEGALVGVFLPDENLPCRITPETLNFTPAGSGTAFTNLAPQIGQVFFIGDGYTGSGEGEIQKFVAPAGATRLFVGIADGFSFDGQPGAYEDNDGFYEVVISEVIIGTDGDDALIGDSGKEIIYGLGGADVLVGNDGNDMLIGSYGNDLLQGDAGADAFVLDQIQIDTILDFQPIDKIVLDKNTFTELENSPVTFASVDSIEKAQNSSALITYISSTGALYYNKNGSETSLGSGGQIADLTDGLDLLASNFVVRA